MTTGTVVWLVVAAVSAVLFFGIAAVVSIYGMRNLRQLLDGADQAKKEHDRQSA